MQNVIQFSEATLKAVDYPDNQRVLKAVAVIEAPLTADIARALKCGHLYKPNGDPIDSVGKYAAPVKLSDTEFRLPSGTAEGGLDTYRPQLIWSFNITPVNDLQLRIQFRVHITGDDRGYELLATRIKYLGKKLECSIRSLQETFNFSEESGGSREHDDEDDDESARAIVAGGAVVDAEYNDCVAGAEFCIHCSHEIPLNEDGKHMLEGGLAECARATQASKPKRSPAPASRQAMGVKNQKVRRRRLPAPTAEEVEAAVSVQ